MKHVPVMLAETIEFFDPQPGQIYIDCTFGGGGHTRALLERGCIVIAIDRDADAKKYADELISQGYPLYFYNRIFSHIEQIHQQWMWDYVYEKYHQEIIAEMCSVNNLTDVNDSNISQYETLKAKTLEKMITDNKIPRPQIAGILADFGICTHQLNNGRGFSFQNNDPLDMRMGRSKITAKDILNQYSEDALADMFYYLSDEKFSRLIAKKIVQYRSENQITHMNDLLTVFREQTHGIHPATKVLQALRIEVNQELKEIHELLHQIRYMKQTDPMKVVCISFHSGEDRIVKNVLGQWEKDNVSMRKNTKLLTPSEKEIKSNPPSRSAKLRHCVRIFEV